jgi:DNA-binding beta-propeller fold protein YncE
MIAAKASASVRLFAILLLGSILSCSSPPSRSSRYERLIVSAPSDGFTNFETEPVHPIALSSDGRYLYALNTADDRLEIFDARGETLRSVGETAVGIRPVAIALRGHQAWVVNHLSDSVNVVDVSDPARPTVVHTLQVGDEPRGAVVAGPNHDRIFVATAYRGETLTPGIGRAQLWIFDAEKPEAPPQKLTLFGTKPRALAVSSDGRRVYAAVFLSGNGTTSVSGEDAVRLGRARQLNLDEIPYSAVPKQGPIVRRVDGHWRDGQGRDWSAAVPFELPDYDVFAIDAASERPRVVDAISNVGTVLFNMAVRPGNREIWVSNSEAFNHISHESRLNGRFAQNRVTRVIPDAPTHRSVAVHLNPHVESDVSEARAKRHLTLSQPLDLVFQPDGREAYVAAYGSGKIGVLDAQGNVIERIAVGFGPGGLALDSRRGRLYVLNHLEGTISMVDVRQRRTVGQTSLRHNPTPEVIKRGRKVFYDALLTSGFGDLSCATCHVFGDTDGLAWDLGDPAGSRMDYPARLRNTGLAEPRQALHPLKGPMVTQTLRGLAGTAPYHWRGDRFGLPTAPGDDLESFKDFKPAFVDLLGRTEDIADESMEALSRYIFTIRFPPNPFQRLDRLMDSEERAGFDFFTGPFLSGAGQQNCVSCHQLPTGTNRLINFEGPQIGRDMKTAQLRNVYDKIGRFNVAGPQVSGFGLLHDGTFDTVVSFLRLEVFFFPGKSEDEKDIVRRQLHHYIMAFDTGMAPAVGRQLTVAGEPSVENRKLLHLLEIRSAAEECDLAARVWEGKVQRGWLYRNYSYHADQRGQTPLETAALLDRYRASREPITFTCVPPGDGQRSALDREMNGILDGDETPAAAERAAAMSVTR